MWYHLKVQNQLALFWSAYALLSVPSAHLISLVQEAYLDPEQEASRLVAAARSVIEAFPFCICSIHNAWVDAALGEQPRLGNGGEWANPI